MLLIIVDRSFDPKDALAPKFKTDNNTLLDEINAAEREDRRKSFGKDAIGKEEKN